MKFFSSALLGVTLLLSFPTAAQVPKEKLHAPKFNFMPFSFPITTSSAEAQEMFNQGMILYYGFEWGESTRSFKAATSLDPNCAMCYWGVALSLGSKMNAPEIGTEYKEARESIQKALSLSKYSNAMEKGLINSLSLKFAHPANEPLKTQAAKSSTYSCHNTNHKFDASTNLEKLKYANAMEKISRKFPNSNVKALHAYALIEWGFWGVYPENKLLTYRIVKILDSVLKTEPLHVGANHYYIHVVEPSSNPSKALANADRLRNLVPSTEHLVHMPAHIYFLTGRFHEASEANQKAIETFKQYNNSCIQQGFQPEINYLYFHNYDFLRSSAAMEGRKQTALTAAQEMVNTPFPQWLEKEPDLQWFIPIPWFVEARFALWGELLKEPKPPEKYSYALGMWHYVRGMAFVHSGNQLDKAREEHAALEKIVKTGPSNLLFNEKGIKLLQIANHVLLAFIADASSNGAATINNLKTAMKLQDNLGYHEPPDWYFPISEMLGDAYLKWGDRKAALLTYQKNLKEYPQNPWGLWGLSKTLRLLGDHQKAHEVEIQFNTSWKYSDIPSPRSYFSPLEDKK
jgi:tetratricopeptide (TPR) repeat protein